ncbi:uncharacterized protein TRIADDRAFT_58287 [Trichoplax adhaerens]|uniref:GAR domain-containing protein n=1 Tax=Trichoplax adhaerens TaxID=10228 RepID=B3S1H0_TRIAD|nr:hypothetical protein TRIADDRAFT_58287 [Trichoplax adhaerens]EDV23541.1 hypothetical protein TRIADDRAFT_58287 [Trichoplax adhaerens]|eukprot:XP_002114451.1 hypothetical protein TRIADDRAFT_58287 [Trichoplax adhaerens]
MDTLQHTLSSAEQIYRKLDGRLQEWSQFLTRAKKYTQEFWQYVHQLKTSIKMYLDTVENLKQAVNQAEIDANRKKLQEIKDVEVPRFKSDIESLNKVMKEIHQITTEDEIQRTQFNVDEIIALLADLEQRLQQGLEYLEELEKAIKNFVNIHGIIENIVEEFERKIISTNFVKSSTIESLHREIDYYKNLVKKINKRQHDKEKFESSAKNLCRRHFVAYEKLQGSEIVKEIACRWDALTERSTMHLNTLETILKELLHAEELISKTNEWINQYDKSISELKFDASEKDKVQKQVSQLQDIHKQINAKESDINEVISLAEKISEICPNHELLENINFEVDEISRRWHNLLEKAAYRQSQLLDCFLTSQELENTVKEFTQWLSQVEKYFGTKHPIAALPSTAEFHLDEFKVFVEEEIPSRKEQLETIKKVSRDFVSRSEATTAHLINDLVSELKASWNIISNKITARQKQLSDELDEARKFQDRLQEFESWLETAESKMDSWDYVSTNNDVLKNQLEDQKAFNMKLDEKHEDLNQISSTTQVLMQKCNESDAKQIKSSLRSINQRWNKLLSCCIDREYQINQNLESAGSFYSDCADMLNWLKEANFSMQEVNNVGIDPQIIQEQISKHQEFQNELGYRRPTVAAIISKGKLLRHSSQPKDIALISEYLADLKLQWKRVCNKAALWQEELEECLLASGKLTATLSALLEWLAKIQPELSSDVPYYGDIDTVKELLDNHKVLQRELGSRTKIKSKINMSAKYLATDTEDKSAVTENLKELNQTWDTICTLSVERQEKLQDALSLAQKFHIQVRDIVRNLGSADKRLKESLAAVDENHQFNRLSAKLKGFEQELGRLRQNFDAVMKLGNIILENCHHNAVGSVRHWMNIVRKSWNDANEKLNRYNIKLDELSNEVQNDEKLLMDIENWIAESTVKMEEPIKEADCDVEKLIEQHKAFERTMANKYGVIRNTTASLNKIRRGASFIPITAKKINHDSNNVASTRLKNVNSGWNNLEKLVEKKGIKLQKMLYDQALQKMKQTFDWDVWRKGVMRHFNDKVAKVNEFLRPISNNNKIYRNNFVRAFIDNGCSTSETEMECVANRFDKNGFIDTKEFLGSLRPSAFKQPKTDAEKIDTEILRLVADCKCMKPFRVSRAGEGKYRFGESQKLRLVRILRNSVMVRVGGGWEELSVFLSKNDPCRSAAAKKELKEKFILADGVHQSMQGFKTSMKSPREATSKFRRYIYTPVGSDDDMSDAGSEFSTLTQRAESQSNLSDDVKSTISCGSQQSLNNSLHSATNSPASKLTDTSKASKIPYRNKRTMIPKPNSSNH